MGSRICIQCIAWIHILYTKPENELLIVEFTGVFAGTIVALPTAMSDFQSTWLAPLLVVAVGLTMMVRERSAPGRHLEGAPGFARRAWAFSLAQAAAVWSLAGPAQSFFSAARPWPGLSLDFLPGAAVGYLVVTFAGYWWHRARHASPFLWRWLHQLHHSPGRIEVLTSFYKHPLEIMANVMLSTMVLTGLLGLGPESAAAATLASGLAELVYHWNVRTPRWFGFFFQRPEMHCVHHERDRHSSNYGDLPLWDWLFGTYENPPAFDGSCGFGVEKEAEVMTMLGGVDLFEEAHPPRSGRRRAMALIALGCAHMVFDVMGMPLFAGIAMATASSPAPKVFTSLPDGQGARVEPFADDFEVIHVSVDGDTVVRELTPEIYASLEGPYNRRNTYGAVVAGAAFLEGHALTEPMWRASLEYMACGESTALDELGLPPRAPGDRIVLRQRSSSSTDLHDAVPDREWSVRCR